MSDTDYMRQALAEARLAAAAGELPVGCVVVRDGEIVARAHNECEARRDATGHAELLAIRRAGAALGGWRLSDCTLYVTLEPCPMCAGAVVQARVGRLVYGASNPEQGCAGSLYRIPEDPAFPHFCPSDGGVLAGECAEVVEEFFRKRRARNGWDADRGEASRTPLSDAGVSPPQAAGDFPPQPIGCPRAVPVIHDDL